MKKKVTMGILLIFLLIVIILGIKYEVSSDNEDINQNISGENLQNKNQENKTTEIKGTKQVGNIEISNIKIELVEKNKSKLTASVKNVSKDFLNATNVKIKVINDGQEEISFGGIITELAGYETDTFTTYVMKDILEVKDLEIQKEEM